jgi:hypothetical protein
LPVFQAIFSVKRPENRGSLLRHWAGNFNEGSSLDVAAQLIQRQ